jgi:hypothetical protein
MASSNAPMSKRIRPSSLCPKALRGINLMNFRIAVIASSSWPLSRNNLRSQRLELTESGFSLVASMNAA